MKDHQTEEKLSSPLTVQQSHCFIVSDCVIIHYFILGCMLKE